MTWLLWMLAWQLTPQDQLRQAIALHRQGDAAGAIPLYESVLAARPEMAQVRSNLGAAYSRLGRFAEAQKQFEAALSKEPGNAQIRLNLGLAFYKQNLIVEAAEELERVREARPADRQTQTLLADCYLMMDRNDKVIALIDPATEDRALAYLLGAALIRTGDTRRGQVLVDRILRDGESAEAHYLMAATLIAAQDNRAALNHLQKAVALSPGLRGLHSLHGLAKLRDGDPEGAKLAFEKELQGNPTDYEANLNLGAMHRLEQSYDAAAQYLERARQMRPGSAALRYQLAGLELARGNADGARAILETVIADAPNWVEPHISLATAYYRLKRKEDGDRESAIVRALNQKNQAKELKRP